MGGNKSQVEIACDLGLVVPPEDGHEYPCAQVSMHKPSAGYGTQVHLSEYSIEKFLAQYNLRFDYVYPQSVNEMVGVLDKYKDEDIMICFDVSVIYNQSHNSGHVVLFERIEDDRIVILNHGTKTGVVEKNLHPQELFDAIQLHGQQNMAGLWIVSS